MNRPAVVIVDDHALIASALAVALRAAGVAAEVRPPDELDQRIDPAPPGGLVLLDLDLGDGRDGAALVPPLRRAGWRVLLVTGLDDEIRIATAVAAGAVGRVAKSAPFEELVATVVRVAEGRPLLAEAERRRLSALAGTATREAAALRARFARLTAREREITDRLADGRRPAAIATEFTVSVATVRTQIRSILGKLEVGSQLEAAAAARAWKSLL